MKLNGMGLYKYPDGNTFIGELADREFLQSDGVELLEENPFLFGIELAKYLDGELESANYHSFVGLYTKIYKALLKTLDKESSDSVFDEIAYMVQIP